ncbi:MULTISPECIES: SRPBCC family protein [unclassified Leptolyngbya]|uniref:SRPBCC family protein n=1 Tax=unclassified Leptolyngbya TaxID=2650499 RepID=UPI00168359FD|nr:MULTISPECIES: SRPBCC family protein [unclassified Leptolyngbya]MBD1912894.1 cyclase [Leptolyngbya sp. FACHB-8]MBD2154777.1 cyclase [Leptolyngbya sp. FACHB-16]
MVGGIASHGFDVPAEEPSAIATLHPGEGARLTQGEILVDTQTHTAWGAAVTARMFLPMHLTAAWEQLTDYPRWVQFFPDITRSEVVLERSDRSWKRLYQAATKNFFIFQAQVDIHLKVFEQYLKGQRSRIQFRMERGSFHDFSADLHLEQYENGTLLTYQVKATPAIPVPSVFIQQAIRMDLPANMEQMRRVLLRG